MFRIWFYNIETPDANSINMDGIGNLYTEVQS